MPTSTSRPTRTWTAVSRTEGELFWLVKGNCAAVCTLVSHRVGTYIGWELRLHLGTPDQAIAAEFCQTPSQIVSTGSYWRAKMLALGWSEGEYTPNADRSMAQPAGRLSLTRV